MIRNKTAGVTISAKAEIINLKSKIISWISNHSNQFLIKTDSQYAISDFRF